VPALICDSQTLKELGFPTIISYLEKHALGPSAKQRIQELRPTNNTNELVKNLKAVQEIVSLKRLNVIFPALDFEELTHEIQLLGITDAVLPAESFFRIVNTSVLINEILQFFEINPNKYPLIKAIFKDCVLTKELINSINKVLDRRGIVKDDASNELALIRQKMKSLKAQINRNFERELRKWRKENILGETYETFINERRVLTVQSTYKRKVAGSFLGSSKTGSLSYVEPLANVALNQELDWLIDDEIKEIRKILQQLTREISYHLPLIIAYHTALCTYDFTNAKAKLAIEMNACLPIIEKTPQLKWNSAFHPILRQNNQLLTKKTLPQDIVLDKNARILVISGPNAGGKSITLKTVGLLQVMLQSGLLIPVDSSSKASIFNEILSDIGDNQSIDNELSTYSYRLKRINYFLQIASKESLFLLDEFGTGSDPDLGGAIAEVFFESLYEKECFSVITTHYTNIKIKAGQLEKTMNGCMLFDVSTLKPLFQLSIGQPGSSFTFEIAKIVGISEKLIKKAKDSLGDNKIRFDKLLSSLQKDKNEIERLITTNLLTDKKAKETIAYYESMNDKLTQRLQSSISSIEVQSRQINLGKKVQVFIERYNLKSKKKGVNDELIEEIKRMIIIEKSKQNLKKSAQVQTKNKERPLSAKQQVALKELDKIKVGSKVSITSTNQIGIVDRIKGDEVHLEIGNVRLKVQKSKLLLLD
jgi:DNA mismatch repair protein MutS2